MLVYYQTVLLVLWYRIDTALVLLPAARMDQLQQYNLRSYGEVATLSWAIFLILK